jgi:membrane-associated protease RseP (regulator of RpoE activity)
MRNHRIIIVLLTSLAAIGAASADTRFADDSVQVTVAAGKGRLGVTVLQISPELRRHFGAPSDRGVMVDAITPDSPAARAGLRVGDVIVEVEGDSAMSATDVLEAMSDRKKGEPVAIAIVRAGQRSELRATLADDPGPVWHRGAPRAIDPQLRRWLDEPFSSPSSHDDVRKQIKEFERRLQRLEKQ